MVTLVPWQLESAKKFNPFERMPMPGDARRGVVVRPRVRRHPDGKRAQNRVTHVNNVKDED